MSDFDDRPPTELDDRPPADLQRLIDGVPAAARAAILAAWRDVVARMQHEVVAYANRNLELINKTHKLVWRMIRWITAALVVIAVVVGGLGYLSVRLTLEQGHNREEAFRASCVADNHRYHRAVGFIALLAKVQSGRAPNESIAQLARDEGLHPSPALVAKIKKIESGTPSAARDAQIQQGQLEFNALINDLAPLHKDCGAYAARRAHTS